MFLLLHHIKYIQNNKIAEVIHRTLENDFRAFIYVFQNIFSLVLDAIELNGLPCYLPCF